MRALYRIEKHNENNKTEMKITATFFGCSCPSGGSAKASGADKRSWIAGPSCCFGGAFVFCSVVLKDQHETTNEIPPHRKTNCSNREPQLKNKTKPRKTQNQNRPVCAVRLAKSQSARRLERTAVADPKSPNKLEQNPLHAATQQHKPPETHTSRTTSNNKLCASSTGKSVLMNASEAGGVSEELKNTNNRERSNNIRSENKIEKEPIARSRRLRNNFQSRRQIRQSKIVRILKHSLHQRINVHSALCSC